MKMKKALLSLLLGVAVGCTIYIVIGMIFILVGMPATELWPGYTFIHQAIGGMIIGIAFSLPSLIYDNEKLSIGLKMLIHMGIGMAVFSITAMKLGWIPVSHGPIAVFIFFVIAAGGAFGIWGCFYLYHKNEAKLINQRIKAKQQS